ncbi:hypothetical protein [Arenibacter sp. F20364]|uniref:hypothetical protein n=1 Tax=Arenibacter sp. F20364 TaxID=2926415 RepID=UPI001FF62D61|nr:hypothetical protein [Arenibacter sp. F20364]MCK0188915.1 hypothetical protein [Arenibacter sp. F20364]
MTGNNQHYSYGDYSLKTRTKANMFSGIMTPRNQYSPFDIDRVGDEIDFDFIADKRWLPIGVVNTLYLKYHPRTYPVDETHYFYLMDKNGEEVKLESHEGTLAIEKAVLLLAEEGNFSNRLGVADARISLYYKRNNSKHRRSRSILDLNLIFLDQAKDYLKNILEAYPLSADDKLEIMIDYMKLEYGEIIISKREYQYVILN